MKIPSAAPATLFPGLYRRRRRAAAACQGRARDRNASPRSRRCCRQWRVDVIDDIKPGMTEQEFAAKIDWRIKSAGFERCSFETIVASGPNSALPHAHPGDRVMQGG